jgi:hypothetical protein
MKQYLELLGKRGLVLEYDAKVYTTDAGNEYLLYYDELIQLLKNNVKIDPVDLKTTAQAREQQ